MITIMKTVVTLQGIFIAGLSYLFITFSDREDGNYEEQDDTNSDYSEDNQDNGETNQAAKRRKTGVL